MNVTGRFLLGSLTALFLGVIAAPTSAAVAAAPTTQAALASVDALASMSPQDDPAPTAWCYDPYWGWYQCSW